MAKTIRNLESLYGKGEMGKRNPEDLPNSYGAVPFTMDGRYGWNPPMDGFQAQGVNGTMRATGSGWNGSEWKDDSPELPASPTRPSGRSNRTGE